jgi:hypothetical protein
VTKKAAGASRILGAGLSVRDWIANNPDRFVTRREIGLLFGMLKHAEDRITQKNTLGRRFWRWLSTPILGHQEAPSSSPSSVSPSPAHFSVPFSSGSGGAKEAAVSLPNASPSTGTQ